MGAVDFEISLNGIFASHRTTEDFCHFEHTMLNSLADISSSHSFTWEINRPLLKWAPKHLKLFTLCSESSTFTEQSVCELNILYPVFLTSNLRSYCCGRTSICRRQLPITLNWCNAKCVVSAWNISGWNFLDVTRYRTHHRDEKQWKENWNALRPQSQALFFHRCYTEQGFVCLDKSFWFDQCTLSWTSYVPVSLSDNELKMRCAWFVKIWWI